MVPAVMTGLKIGAAVLPHLFGRPKKPKIDLASVNAKYMGMRPGGYLTSEDQSFVDRQLARTMETVGVQGRNMRQLAARRMAQRGITGPASEQAFADINQNEQLAGVGAQRNAGDLAYGIYGNNRDFERSKMMKGWGIEAGDAMQQRSDYQAAQSEFWNSQLQFLPQLLQLGSAQKANQSTEQKQ